MTANNPRQVFDSFQVVDAFKSVLIKELGAAPDTIEPGPILRFDDPKGKRSNKACYCQLFSGGHPAGYFGNWRTGEYQTWVYGGTASMTLAERHLFRQQVAQAREKREQEQAACQNKARAKAANLWKRCSSSNADHPYLKSKQISPGISGQLANGCNLILPLFGFDDQLWSLQFVGPDGDKRFLTGGRKKGCFIPVQTPKEISTVLICEGWATGQTLAESHPDSCVLAALDAGNLKPVALGARQRWPECSLTICGDDDRNKEMNTGRIKAREAAIAAGAQVALPDWPDNAPTDLTDFNDLANWLMAGGQYGP